MCLNTKNDLKIYLDQSGSSVSGTCTRTIDTSSEIAVGCRPNLWTRGTFLIPPGIVTLMSSIATPHTEGNSISRTTGIWSSSSQHYTQNCELECLANYTVQQYGCAQFARPPNRSTRVCGLQKMECKNAAIELFHLKELFFVLRKCFYGQILLLQENRFQGLDLQHRSVPSCMAQRIFWWSLGSPSILSIFEFVFFSARLWQRFLEHSRKQRA